MIRIKLNEDIQNPKINEEYVVVETGKSYDPEGLNIEDNSVRKCFFGTHNECKKWLDDFVDKELSKSVPVSIYEEGKDFVCLYYPRAISKSYYYIKKNEGFNFPMEKTEDDYIIDLFNDRDWKNQKLAVINLMYKGRGMVPDCITSYDIQRAKAKYQDLYNELK